MADPTTQAELDNQVNKLKPEIARVSAELTSCKEKVSEVEAPSGWDRFGQIILTGIFPVAGFYFGYKEIERIIATQPAVQEKLNEAETAVSDILSELGELMSPGNPFIMKTMADSWDEVNRHLTGSVGPMADESFCATTSWTDAMGQQYSKLPAIQRAALEGLLPHVDSMRTLLRTHATDIVDLWGDLIEEIFDLAIDAIPLASKFINANPLKWLELAEPIADCIARFLEAILNIGTRIREFTMASYGRIDTLKSDMSNISGSYHGSWPVARLG
ncbi:hypothetical protein GCM10022198_16520 [Klugiella xanthotipulae]|uniref:Uncharacterized protein n=1 Tax=Klugiella xanthotipulae TaxID=244735 RepID=A0A543HH76_9MICO|nr:hypothetical protein [Klugiella xanthotipulae]TQM57688.1 hypothetical protein FB466_2684 [Klugiella xanthotipulae]